LEALSPLRFWIQVVGRTTFAATPAFFATYALSRYLFIQIIRKRRKGALILLRLQIRAEPVVRARVDDGIVDIRGKRFVGEVVKELAQNSIIPRNGTLFYTFRGKTRKGNLLEESHWE
jgi:hypothetical protein